jgi:ABC-type nitrate/sulfonate/bicarbonate transport system permease component
MNTSQAGIKSQVLRIQVATVVLCAAAWEATARSGLFYAGIFPPLESIIRSVGSELGDSGFYHDLFVTLAEATVGFFAGALIGLTLGIWLGLNPFVRKAVEPYINAIGGTPKIIFLPILFLIFGLGMESKMAKGALSAFFPVIVSATYGVMAINPVLLRVGRSFYLTRWQIITRICLPAMVNPMLTGLRLGIAMSFIGILAAEISYSNSGLGFRLAHYADAYKISAMYATIVLIFMLTACINTAITRLQQRLNRHERALIDIATVGPTLNAAASET